MIEISLYICVFALIFALYLTRLRNRIIIAEQNVLIQDLKGEASFIRKECRRDIEMLNWADKAGHYDAQFGSTREELRSAMEKDNA